ncbi:hypothetical protein [Heyndrickxia acidiproducens]|uniref:hypothetical protein n=1 Tax=Heyndrickxia acidiproducens TaxID=1121084 RepID=UPI00037B7888|nr:hypothetical protein [Heyndrickxia acidiproducens]
MRVGDHVLYKGEVCEIIHIYRSGYCELKKPFLHQIILAHQSEFTRVVKDAQQPH